MTSAEMLGQLAALRRQVRRSLGQPWPALICFGVVALLGAAAVAAVGTLGLVVVWAPSGVAGLWLTRRHYRARAARVGVSGPRRTWLVALALFGGCFLAGLLAGPIAGLRAGLVAPILGVLVGYLVLAGLHRDPRPAVAVAPAVVTGVALAWVGAWPWLVEGAFGSLLLTAGLVLRARRARRCQMVCVRRLRLS